MPLYYLGEESSEERQLPVTCPKTNESASVPIDLTSWDLVFSGTAAIYTSCFLCPMCNVPHCKQLVLEGARPK